MADPRHKHRLASRRILVAEDELLLACEVKRMLGEWGCAVLGPVPSVTRALALLDGEPPDAAVLDLNLRGESARPVAAALAAGGVPFVLVTGYGASFMNEPELRGVARLEKPLDRGKLEAALAAALGLDEPAR